MNENKSINKIEDVNLAQNPLDCFSPISSKNLLEIVMKDFVRNLVGNLFMGLILHSRTN